MNEVLARRFTLRAAKIQERTYDRAFIQEIDDLLLFPRFEDKSGWQRYVDDEIKDIWTQLDKAMRLAIYLTATKAHHEASNKPVVPDHPPYHGVRG